MSILLMALGILLLIDVLILIMAVGIISARKLQCNGDPDTYKHYKKGLWVRAKAQQEADNYKKAA